MTSWRKTDLQLLGAAIEMGTPYIEMSVIQGAWFLHPPYMHDFVHASISETGGSERGRRRDWRHCGAFHILVLRVN
jgi:hypothetical protein